MARTKKQEQPVVEAPVVEAPVVEQPAVEAPAVEQPAVEAPAEEKAVEEAKKVDLNKGYIEKIALVEVPMVSAHQNIIDELGDGLKNAGKKFLSMIPEGQPLQAVVDAYEAAKVEAVDGKTVAEVFAEKLDAVKDEYNKGLKEAASKAANHYDKETRKHDFDKDKVLAGDKAEQAKFVEHVIERCSPVIAKMTKMDMYKYQFPTFKKMGKALAEREKSISPKDLKLMIAATLPEILKQVPGMETMISEKQCQSVAKNMFEGYDIGYQVRKDKYIEGIAGLTKLEGAPEVSAHQNILDEIGADLPKNARDYLAMIPEGQGIQAVTDAYEAAKAEGKGKADLVESVKNVVDGIRNEERAGRIKAISTAKWQEFDPAKVLAGDKDEQAKFAEHLVAKNKGALYKAFGKDARKDIFAPYQALGESFGQFNRGENAIPNSQLKKMFAASLPAIAAWIPGSPVIMSEKQKDKIVETFVNAYDGKQAQLNKKQAQKEAAAAEKAAKANEGAAR